MAGSGGETLTDHDRRVVRQTLEEVAATPPPAVRARMGGLAGIAGLVLLVVWPRVVDAVPGGAFLSPFMLLLGAVLLVGGPLMAILGGAGPRAAAAVEAALRRLEDPEVDRETTLRAATLLLLHASAVEGAAAPQGADPDEVARRIGGRLSLVRAVERYLVERGSVAPFVGGRA